jgi:hypothetical protein
LSREPNHRRGQAYALLAVMLFTRLVVVSTAQREANPAIVRGFFKRNQSVNEGSAPGVSGLGPCQVDPLVLIEVYGEHVVHSGEQP